MAHLTIIFLVPCLFRKQEAEERKKIQPWMRQAFRRKELQWKFGLASVSEVNLRGVDGFCNIITNHISEQVNACSVSLSKIAIVLQISNENYYIIKYDENNKNKINKLIYSHIN